MSMKLNWCQYIGVVCVIASVITLMGLFVVGILWLLVTAGWAVRMTMAALLLFIVGIIIAVVGSR